jgi:diguanylate cyclase (GGDEF)-like protein/PAS domain S-box-containing protein
MRKEKTSSKKSEDYQGVKKERLIIAGGVLTICISILLAYTPLFSLSIILYALSCTAAALIIGAGCVWLYWFIARYTAQVEKCSLTARRFQNISKYFESILQDSSDIIFSVDTDGYILKFNRGAELHFGYSQEAIVGKPLKQLFVNEADEQKIVSNVLLNGKSVNDEVPMKKSNGEIILLNLSMSEMKNDLNHIIGLVVTAKDMTERKRLEMELIKKNELLGRLAITDSLTELYNVRHFYDQIKRELSRFKRNPERTLSLLLMDIDHFKELNDNEGHQTGDHVLKSLGEVIKVCIRKDIDTGYRYGGDEFIIILPDTDKHQALNAAQRIQKQFGAFRFGRTSLSIGIAEAEPDDDEKNLLRKSDMALYKSKNEGRNRITVS